MSTPRDLLSEILPLTVRRPNNHSLIVFPPFLHFNVSLFSTWNYVTPSQDWFNQSISQTSTWHGNLLRFISSPRSENRRTRFIINLRPDRDSSLDRSRFVELNWFPLKLFLWLDVRQSPVTKTINLLQELFVRLDTRCRKWCLMLHFYVGNYYLPI